jgi:RNA polymerase sigma factor (sigma-70 family)
LFRVTRNRVKMHYRSTVGKETAGDPVHHRSIEDASLSVEIEDTLAGLPAEYREAIELRYIMGLSGAEAAAAMGRSHGAFRMLLHRATEQFKREFVS